MKNINIHNTNYITKYIIEDGHNTNYISCLLLSLFLVKTKVYQYILESNETEIKSLYLQEIIKEIIKKFKKYNIMTGSSLNYFRNYIYLKKFKDFNTIFDNNSIEDLYNFISNQLNLQKIELINTLKMSVVESLYFLELNCNQNINLKHLLKTNLSDKILNNIPNIIAIKLNRTNNCYIDIQKKISIISVYNYADIISSIDTSNLKDNKLLWSIYSIICMCDNKYCSFIYYKHQWIYINEDIEKNIQIVNIKDYEDKIKKYAVFLIYSYIT